MNLTSRIIAYEDGELYDFNDVRDLFQDLINTGMAWTLQGSYGRMAMHFIESGYCTRPTTKEIVESLVKEGEPE